MKNCIKCHFTGENLKTECDKCKYGYYIDSNKNCKECRYPIMIQNGRCRICSDNDNDYNLRKCYCDKNYTLSDDLSTCI